MQVECLWAIDHLIDVKPIAMEKSSSCVIIIIMRLLHVPILELIQLVCSVRLRPNHKCILKAFQCLAFGTPSKLVNVSFYHVVVEVCFFNRTQFGQWNGLQTNLLTNCIYIQQEVIPICSRGKNILNDLLPRWECTCFVRHHLSKRHNDGG